MSAACCPTPTPPTDLSYRRVLWIALFANAIMFVVELAAAVFSGSSALAADAADFLGDSANYALSLGAIALGGRGSRASPCSRAPRCLLYGVAVLAYAAGGRGSAFRRSRSRWA